MATNKEDNSMPHEKAALRRKFLPENARVLDCFCGTGQMYHLAYAGRVAEYHGLDREKVHDPNLCEIANNAAWVRRNDISRYNVFDLDAYGVPWKLFHLIVRALPETLTDVTFFITDGSPRNMDMCRVTPMVSATEHIPKGMVIPALGRWYADIFATMLFGVCTRYRWRVTRSCYFHNANDTAAYWAVLLERPGN